MSRSQEPSTRVTDGPADGAFDRVARLATTILDVPIAVVTVVDHEDVWVRPVRALAASETVSGDGFCASVVIRDDLVTVEEARRDPCALANPAVAEDLGFRFHAESPLRTGDGRDLGSICIIDREPRDLGDRDRRILEELGALVVGELELRLAAHRVDAAATERTVLLGERQRQAVQLNDEVVQRLALAKLALELGDHDGLADHIDGALVSSKRILGGLAAGAPSLRREQAALGG